MGVCDLHCHLLPEIDDGYVSAEQFSRMLNLYAESGITTIAFTPHIYNPYVTTNVAKLRSTYQWAKELASSLGLVTYLGSELYVGEQDELLAFVVGDVAHGGEELDGLVPLLFGQAHIPDEVVQVHHQRLHDLLEARVGGVVEGGEHAFDEVLLDG